MSLDQLRFLIPDWYDVREILIVAYVVYRLLLFLAGTRALQILVGITALGLIYFGALVLKLNVITTLLGVVFTYGAFAAVVVFQPELGNKKTLSPNEQLILKAWDKSHHYLRTGFPEIYKKSVEKAKEFCSQRNISYIDINEEAEFSENPKTLFYDVVHPNEMGHKIIAEILNEKLDEL